MGAILGWKLNVEYLARGCIPSQQAQVRGVALQLKNLALRDLNLPVAGYSHLSYSNVQFLVMEGRAPANIAIENLFPTIGSVFQSQVVWMPTTNDIRVAERVM
jgi:hypothetical protein